MSIPILLKVSLNREFLPLDRKSIVYIAFDVICDEGFKIQEAMSTAISIVIDRSGSMRGKKLEQAKLATENLINQLQPGDYIGMVTFSSKSEELLYLEKIQNIDVADLKRKIFKIKCGGGTELFNALETAFKQFELTGMTSPKLVKRIILLSDGQPTDHMPESLFARLASEIGEAGIAVTAMGLGKEYNEDLLSNIAEHSHGVWKHISTPEEMPSIFKEQLDETRVVVRTKTNLVIKASNGVEFKSLRKSMPTVYDMNEINLSAAEIVIPLGDIRRGEGLKLVARLSVSPLSSGKQLLVTSLIKDEASSNVEIFAEFANDDNLLQSESNPEVRGYFFGAETQILTIRGLSGDETALHHAKELNETMLRDSSLTNIPTVKANATKVKETIVHAEKGLDPNETKAAKNEMTQVHRR